MAMNELRRLLIGGASRGIGLGLARAFLASGGELVAVARDLSRAEGLRALKAEYGERLTLLECDLTATDAAQRIAAALDGRPFDALLLEDSAGGLLQVLTGQLGRNHCAFLDHEGAALPW